MAGRQSTGAAYGFPFETVMGPATIAGLLVVLGNVVLNAVVNGGFGGVQGLVLTLINSLTIIAIIAAFLGVTLAGTRTDVLGAGSVLVYVAGFLASLISTLYVGGSLSIDLGLFVGPLGSVILFLGFALAYRWAVEGNGVPW